MVTVFLDHSQNDLVSVAGGEFLVGEDNGV